MGKQKSKKSRATSAASTGENVISENFNPSRLEAQEEGPAVSQGVEAMKGDSVENCLEQSALLSTSDHSIELIPDDSPTQAQLSPSSHHAKVPWLSNDGTGPHLSSSDDGFDMDASFVTSNFDLETVASDTDDDCQKREGGGGGAISGETAEERLAEVLSQQGIRLSIDIQKGKSWSDLSDLSLGNQSYIMDLALQKEAREKNLREESLEETFVLYKEAKKKGHGGEAFFLMMLEEIQKKTRESSAEYFKIQDERLDTALDEELMRREMMASVSNDSLPTGMKRTSERVGDFIEERKKRRNSLAEAETDTREAIIRAASELVIEMTDDGDYEWGNDDESGNIEPTKVKAKKGKKKKKKTKKDGKSKKKEKKTKKSSSSSESKTKAHDSSSRNLEKKSERKKKSKKKDKDGSKPGKEPETSGDDIPEKIKNAKDTSDPPKKKKKSKKKLKAKNDSTSGTSSITASEGNDVVGDYSKKGTHRDSTSDRDQEQRPASCPILIVAADEITRPASPPRKPRSRKKVVGRSTSMNERVRRSSSVKERVPPRKRISGLLSAVFGRKGKAAPGEDVPRKASFFRRKKPPENEIDPADRLLPVPGSQLASL